MEVRTIGGFINLTNNHRQCSCKRKFRVSPNVQCLLKSIKTYESQPTPSLRGLKAERLSDGSVRGIFAGSEAYTIHVGDAID